MSSNLIIFGAGASFGSEKSNMPTMGNNLYDELATFNPPGWGSLPQNLVAILKQDFEKGMEELSNNHNHVLTQSQCVMAEYFFNFIPTSSSLYVELAKRIQSNDWDGILATLNYERLLEISFRSVGLEVIPQPTKYPQIEVCYPHGCCNFFCEGISGQGITLSKNKLVFNGPGSILRFDKPESSVNFTPDGITTGGQSIKRINDPNLFSQKINNSFPPVMSYFIPSKFTTSCANFIKSQRIRFQKLISEADKIAIIGLKIRPHDQHVWDPISKSSAKVIYCSGSSGKDYKQWAKSNRSNAKNDLVLSAHWEQSFDRICSELGL